MRIINACMHDDYCMPWDVCALEHIAYVFSGVISFIYAQLCVLFVP